MENLSWESVVSVLTFAALIIGIVKYFASKKKETQEEVKAQEASKATIVAVDNKQDLKIKELEMELLSIKQDVSELKSNVVNLEGKIFNAVDKINDKIDNLITTLMNSK